MGTVSFIKYAVISSILSFCFHINMYAQSGPDPGRAGLFIAYAQQAKRVLKAQDVLLGMNLTGHKYLKDEVEKTTNFQREFNNYLDSFDDILTVAADIYGIYTEIDQAIKNMKVVKHIVVRQPANVLAVALSKSKNNIYTDIIENGLKLAADIEQVLPLRKDPDKNAKMTQYERFKVMDNIRVNLRQLNKKLRTLSRLIHYTTLMDTWYDIKNTGREYQPRKMGSITQDCLKNWMRTAKSIKH